MNTPTKIVAIGDSITQAARGRNSFRRDLWNKLVRAGHDVDFVGSEDRTKDNTTFPDGSFDPDHEGHWGWRIDEIINGRNGAPGLRNRLRSYTADIALIHLGTNDVLQGQSAQSSVAELKQTIDILRQDNPKIVILLAQLIPTSKSAAFNSQINALNALIPSVVSEKNRRNSPVVLVNQNSGFSASRDTYDTVHPNESGEAKMAQKWFNALRPFLDITPPPPPTNRAPIAKNDSATTRSNRAVRVDVLGNDRDPDGDRLRLQGLEQGRNGRATIVNNQIRYKPNARFTGRDTIRYTVTDGKGQSAVGRLQVRVQAAKRNRPPKAVDDRAQTQLNRAVRIDVLGNDKDRDGDRLRLSKVTKPKNGQATISKGEILYRPKRGFVGSDRFFYTIKDGKGGIDTAKVRVDIKRNGSLNVTQSGANPSSGRVKAGLIGLYTFDEGAGSTVFDTSGVGSAVNLEVDDLTGVSWGNDGTLTLTGDSLIASTQAATKYNQRIRRSQALTIEAWISPEKDGIPKVGRIATLSADASNRNVTLGQAGDEYVGRLRTTVTGNNGSRRLVTSTGGVAKPGMSHVVYTRDAGGQAALYVDNVLVGENVIDGTLSNWSNDFQFALGNEINGRRGWQGKLDAIALYDQAFSTNEVEQNYLAGSQIV